MKTAHRTDVGKVRQVNEDRAVVLDSLYGFTLAVVADGMGGHQAGDTASQTTIEVIQQELQSIQAELPEEEWNITIRSAIYRANEKVFQMASHTQRYKGMGTTVVVALADKQSIVLGHIGDSRAYLVSKEEFKQLTEDHTLVNELVKSGQITEEQASQHPRRNVLTRALGTEPHIEVDVNRYLWKPHDILLLCTDGLTNLVQPDLIAETLRMKQSVEWKAERLVELALREGGDDNITVVLLANEQRDWEEEGET